jgi:hypothetical protein
MRHRKNKVCLAVFWPSNKRRTSGFAIDEAVLFTCERLRSPPAFGAGIVLFHRSGDKHVGRHGNSGIWRPTPESHRIALVLYQASLARNADPMYGCQIRTKCPILHAK